VPPRETPSPRGKIRVGAAKNFRGKKISKSLQPQGIPAAARQN
jgi:hypothetical protein